MNALINNGQTEYHIEEKKENYGTKTYGDIFAVSLVGMYTLSALVISSWSAVLLLTGNTSNGGPIGIIFNKILLSVIL